MMGQRNGSLYISLYLAIHHRESPFLTVYCSQRQTTPSCSSPSFAAVSCIFPTICFSVVAEVLTSCAGSPALCSAATPCSRSTVFVGDVAHAEKTKIRATIKHAFMTATLNREFIIFFSSRLYCRWEKSARINNNRPLSS